MTPEENTNNNKPNLGDALKIGIDPVFKGNKDTSQKEGQTESASAYNVLSNQKYRPSQPYSPGPSLKAKPKEDPEKKSIVRTYQDDIREAIASNHLSSVNIAIAENEKMRKQVKEKVLEQVDPRKTSKNKTTILISIILIIVGFVSMALVYLYREQGSGTVAKVEELPSLITTEYRDESNTSMIVKGKIVPVLASKISDIQIPIGNFYSTYLTVGASSTKRLINSTEFVSLVEFGIPDIIKRTLLPDFMLGMYSSLEKNCPFIILKTSSFDNSYAGMLEWEKNMRGDLKSLFRLSGYENGGNILSELAPTASKNFEDGVIVNKNVRLLRNDKGEIELVYGIVDKETLVITVNDKAFKEIVNRLNKEGGLKR